MWESKQKKPPKNVFTITKNLLLASKIPQRQQHLLLTLSTLEYKTNLKRVKKQL